MVFSGIRSGTVYYTSDCFVVLWRSVGDGDFPESSGTAYSGSCIGKWNGRCTFGVDQYKRCVCGGYSGKNHFEDL